MCRYRWCYTWIVSMLLLAVLLAGAPQPIAAQSEPVDHGLRFDAPPYALRGPYAVGVRYFTIPAAAETDRELTASVWYPAKDTEDAEFVYEPQFEPGQIPPFSTLGHAALDAEPDDSGAPYPLVVYTHALWSMAQEVPYLTEHLASRGYVVVSVDHEDNWSTDFGPMPYESLIRRPQEVTREIDFAEEISAPGGDLEGMITTEKVGIAGWSMGGVTSVMEAGARMDLDNLRAWCEEDPTHAAFGACTDVVGNEEAMAKFAGLDEVPAGLWPAQNDERIAAAVRLSGSMPYFGEEGLAAVDLPVLLMHGGYEEETDPSVEMGNPYESVSSARKAQVVFEGSGHFTFFSSCEASPDVYNNSLAIGFPTFCADAVWDMDRAHDLINHFTTAFFDAELKGDTEAAAAMAPEAVSFPGVQYQSEGYGSTQPTLDPELIGKVEALIQQTMAANDIPGFAISIVKDGELAYANGFGVAEKGTGRPVTPESLFHIASTGKTVVTMAIMQLVDQGLIGLDEPVTKYLPYFSLADDAYTEITIRQLLGHRAGLPDIGGDAVDRFQVAEPRFDDAALEEYVRSLAGEPLLFTPGESYSYSSMGFDILGEVIAKVSGMSFEDYMKQHVFLPLGMEDSTFLFTEADPELLTTPHMYDAAGKAEVIDFYPYDRRHAPSDGLYTSAADMSRMAMAHLNRGELDGVQVFPAWAYDEMWTPLSETGWAEWFGPTWEDYGLGWLLGEDGGHMVYNHTGADSGFQSHLLVVPDANLAIMTMVNIFDREEGSFHAYALGDQIMKVLLLAVPKEAVVAQKQANGSAYFVHLHTTVQW